MKPENIIKREILTQAETDPGLGLTGPWTTDAEVHAAYDRLIEADANWDYESEFRSSGIETGLPCEYSRHYESKSVARQMSDGSWIGWTYWYGGGKHGEPEAVEWMEDAYPLTCETEEKVVTVRKFTKSEGSV